MHLSVAAIALLALGLVHGSSAARAFLELPSDLWENSNTQIKCTSETEGSNYFNIKEGRFWKVDSPHVYFEYAKPCGTNQFKTVNDTTGRISFSTSYTIPTWVNLTNADSGSYRCSLVSCLTNETQVSDSVPMTVHKYNTAPRMLEPTSDMYAYVNDSMTVTFTCEGYTGYPPGNMSLIEYRLFYPSYNSSYRVLYANMTCDENGYAQQSVKLTITFVAGLATQDYYCQTYKAFGSFERTRPGNDVSVSVDYPPIISYTLSGGNNPSKIYREENITIILNKYSSYTLTCDSDSRPYSRDSLRLVSGPSSYVGEYDSNFVSIQFYYLYKEEHLQFECTVPYASTANPAIKFNRTGIVNVLLTSQSYVTNSYYNTTNGSEMLSVKFYSVLILATSVLNALLNN